MKKLSLLMFLVGFLLLKPFQLGLSDMMYYGDDFSYLAHATALAYGQFPSYKKEYYIDGGASPLQSAGAGVMAAPFVAAFSVLDRVQGRTIVQQRTADTIHGTWTVYGFIFSSVFYLWLGCFLLYRGLRVYCGEFESVLAVFLNILCQGIPLMAFRRPVFSHVSEFFLTSLFVWWLLMPEKQRPSWTRGLPGALAFGVLTGCAGLVRLNNAPMMLVWPLLIAAQGDEKAAFRARATNVAVSWTVGAMIVGIFQIAPDLMHRNTGNNAVIRDLILNFQPPVFYIQRLWQVLTGVDWGLVYTAPFILLGLAAGLVMKFPRRKVLLLGCLPLLMNLYVALSWKTQGGWYGYRYLFPAAAPLVTLPLAVFLGRARLRTGRAAVLAGCAVVCVLPLLSMLMFENIVPDLTLAPVRQYWDVSGWGNNTYQVNLWAIFFHRPLEFWANAIKGGPLYVVCYLAMFFNAAKALPPMLGRILALYEPFSPLLFIKVHLIYMLPFILALFFGRGSDGEKAAGR